MLLTDGEPNVFPKKGWIPTLEEYKKNHKNSIPIINCYVLRFSPSIYFELKLKFYYKYFFIYKKRHLEKK